VQVYPKPVKPDANKLSPAEEKPISGEQGAISWESPPGCTRVINRYPRQFFQCLDCWQRIGPSMPPPTALVSDQSLAGLLEIAPKVRCFAVADSALSSSRKRIKSYVNAMFYLLESIDFHGGAGRNNCVLARRHPDCVRVKCQTEHIRGHLGGIWPRDAGNINGRIESGLGKRQRHCV
jgi:hypothetical protein